MHRPFWRSLAVALTAAVLSLAGAALASAHPVAFRHPHGAAARQMALRARLRARYLATHRNARAAGVNSLGGDSDVANQAQQYDFERSLPAATAPGQALAAAAQQADGLRRTGGRWQNVTTAPYNANPPGYTDPFWGNAGSGFSIVGGRTTALAQTPDGTWYAGTADGGVWRSSSQGTTWSPVFDSMPTLSVGALAVDPADGSLWVGTGEANTNGDAYAGTGVYRMDPHSGQFALVGGSDYGVNPLVSHTVFQIAFDQQGDAYAATDNGLFRYSAETGQWTEVLDPAGPVDNPPFDNQVTSVAIVPGTSGQSVIAAIGWRGSPNADTANNGFYASSDGGQTFQKMVPTGDINAADIGRTTFAYSADGKKLYAIVESPKMLVGGGETVLQGIFAASGTPASVAGPWTKVADEATLAASGSALPVGSGYGVGVQAWYNQDLAVDPSNDNHIYAGLEEVFQSTDGGGNWVTASPYWNYGLPCGASCPNTTHPDQHAMMIANGKIVIGNDGGVYSRPLSDTQQYGDWSDLNATFESWQYYDARAGRLGRSGIGVVGGLQDNGTSVFGTGMPQMVEPAGGDGIDVIVDPQNANRFLGEYTYGAMYATTDGGHTFGDDTNISPGCDAQAIVGMPPLPSCDPSMRFVTPLIPDGQNVNTWVIGGEDVWVSHAGWNTTCTTASNCTWTNVYDTGAQNAITALASTGDGRFIYAAYTSGGGNPGPAFGVGIATNVGGRWHPVNMAGLPNRYIAGMTVDPADPAHAYAVFNGYSRRWIPGGGVGHVYETYDGGRSWRDISTDLPDIASDALVLEHGQLALATDSGMYTARANQGLRTEWTRLGEGLPNASVNDVTLGPDGALYAATHGRGIWRLPFGSAGEGR